MIYTIAIALALAIALAMVWLCLFWLSGFFAALAMLALESDEDPLVRVATAALWPLMVFFVVVLYPIEFTVCWEFWRFHFATVQDAHMSTGFRFRGRRYVIGLTVVDIADDVPSFGPFFATSWDIPTK